MVALLELSCAWRLSYEAGRLSTTQIAAGRGTDRLIRSSARQVNWLVRQ